jgi:hypothetical protein
MSQISINTTTVPITRLDSIHNIEEAAKKYPGLEYAVCVIFKKNRLRGTMGLGTQCRLSITRSPTRTLIEKGKAKSIKP